MGYLLQDNRQSASKNESWIDLCTTPCTYYANFNPLVNLTNIQVFLSRMWSMNIVLSTTSAAQSTSHARQRDLTFVGIHIILWPWKMGKYRVRHKNGRRLFFARFILYYKSFLCVILTRWLCTLQLTTTMLPRLEWILLYIDWI